MLLWCRSEKLIQELQYLTTVWKIDYLSAAWILFSSTNLRTLHFKIEFSLNPCVRFVLPLASLLYMATGGSGMDFSCPCSWYPAHDPGSCFFFWHPATCYGTFPERNQHYFSGDQREPTWPSSCSQWKQQKPSWPRPAGLPAPVPVVHTRAPEQIVQKSYHHVSKYWQQSFKNGVQ